LSESSGDSEETVVRLPAGYEPPPEPASAPPGRLHGTFIAGMAISALVGVAAMFLFITVGWPDGVRRYIIALIFVAGVLFLACASAAVLSAARDTYPVREGEPLD
jgi:hypothetical protein